MSLSRLAMRIAAARAVRGATLAEGRVFDSVIDPIDMTVAENRSPVLVVMTDEHEATPTGRDLFHADASCDLIIEAAIAARVEIEGQVSIEIPHTDEGMELVLDIIEHQVVAALTRERTPWSRVWMKLVPRVKRRLSRRGASAEGGIRFAARQIVLTCDLIEAPTDGAPVAAGSTWADVLAGLGFSDAEIDELVPGMLTEAGAGLTDPDDVQEPEPVAVSRPGDVWVLGNHRIICGSSTDPVAVAHVLAGTKPHLMVTDPPYGVNYDPAWREKAGVAGPGIAKGKVLNDDKADWREAWALFPGDVAYVWHAGLFAGVVGESLQATGFKLRSQIMWDKGQLVLSRGDYHWQHEPCWYAVREGATGHWAGDRKQTTVWQIPKPSRSETGHGTQKPVDCMKRPIENNSKAGDAVYEPFSGSGTTIIAAEMTGRRCHAVELNPVYVDVAVRRWQEFTGRDAVLESSGATFFATAAALAEADES